MSRKSKRDRSIKKRPRRENALRRKERERKTRLLPNLEKKSVKERKKSLTSGR